MSQDVDDSPRCTLLFCCNGSKPAGHKATESQSSVEVDANTEPSREPAPESQQNKELKQIEDDFRKQFDELGLRPPKNSMPGLERELIIDYWRKAIEVLIDRAVISELERAHRTDGEGLPKRDYDNVTDEYICDRIANLKSKGSE